MPTRKKRSSSLDNSIYNSKRKWLRFIFNGFGTSQKLSKRNKSEKCAYSQTEISNARCNNETGTQYSFFHSKRKTKFKVPSQNVSNKTSKDTISRHSEKENKYSKIMNSEHKVLSINLDGPGKLRVERTLSTIVDDILQENLHESIRNETETIKSVITTQRLKFKDELSSLYHKIYTKDEADEIVNSCYREILIDDRNVHDTFYTSLKMRCKCKVFESIVPSNEKKFKQFDRILQQNRFKDYPVEKSLKGKEADQVTEKNGRHSDSNNSLTNLKRCRNTERNVIEVSISSLNIDLTSGVYLISDHKSSGCKPTKKENNGDDFSHISMILSDDTGIGFADKKEKGVEHLLPQGDQKGFNIVDGRIQRRMSKKTNLNNQLTCRSEQKVLPKEEESSLILDIEILENVHKASIHSDHTFYDLETIDLQDSPYQQKDQLSMRMVGSSGNKMTSDILKMSNYVNQNNQNSNACPSDLTMDSGRSSSPSDTISRNVELICDIGAKHVEDLYLTCSEVFYDQPGNLCEVMSESISCHSDTSFDPIKFLMLGNLKTLAEPNFCKPTISSKLKMKRKNYILKNEDR